MTTEIKYPKRFLDLNMNSPVEDSKMAYDEMAPSWEKVTMKMKVQSFTECQMVASPADSSPVLSRQAGWETGKKRGRRGGEIKCFCEGDEGVPAVEDSW